MRLLLDTHVFLWMQTDPKRLGAAEHIIEDDRNELLLSPASSWEISIKWVLGKLPLPEPPERYVPNRMRVSGVNSLAITHQHALRVGALPNHHNDPFDRLLISQSLVEGIALVTADEALRAYDLDLVWIGAS